MTKYFAAIALVFAIISMPVNGAETSTENQAPNRHGLGLLMDTDKSPVGDFFDQSATVT